MANKDRAVMLWAGGIAIVAAVFPVVQRLLLLPLYVGDGADSWFLAQLNRFSSMLVLPGKVLVYKVWPPPEHHFTTPQLLVAAPLNLAIYFFLLVLVCGGIARALKFRRSPPVVTPADPLEDFSEEQAHSPERRAFLSTAATGTAGFALIASGVYPILIEPGWLSVRRLTVPTRNLPASLNGITIAQLTDFHHDEWISLQHVREAVQLANRLKPDIMALTGDYVTSNPNLIGAAVRELALLKPRIGRWLYWEIMTGGPMWRKPGSSLPGRRSH